MKKIIFQLITFLICGLFSGYTYSQYILIVNDTITITGTAIMTVNGGVSSYTNLGIINNGNIYLKNNTNAGNESWTNNSSQNFLKGNGKVIFNSSDFQTIGGTFSTKFRKLKFDNSSVTGVSLGIDALVSDSLYLTYGTVNTSTNLNKKST